MDLNLSPSEEAFRQEIKTWFEHNLPHEFQTGAPAHAVGGRRGGNGQAMATQAG